MLECVKHGASMVFSDIPSKLTSQGRAWSIDQSLLEGIEHEWEYDGVSSTAEKDKPSALSLPTHDDDEEDDDKMAVIVGKRKDVAQSNQPQKRPKVDMAITADITLPSDPKKASCLDEPISINLRDVKYRRDTRKLMASCDCLSCRSHSRAYIHHLLKVKELLGDILLYQHNQRQLQLLLQTMRERLALGKQELDDWLNAVIARLHEALRKEEE
jgi:hypothetical protein